MTSNLKHLLNRLLITFDIYYYKVLFYTISDMDRLQRWKANQRISAGKPGEG
jgi:hypothetical protein